MYKIEISQKALRQLEKLEQPLAYRIIAALERIVYRPFSFIKKMHDSPYYRFRVGDYRVIMDVRQDKLLIMVIEVGHRKNVYK